MTIAIRRPAWARDGFRIAIDGEPVSRVPAPGSYVELTRTWKVGDTVTLTLPKSLEVVRAPDDLRRAAIVWGPLALAGDLGPGIRVQPGRAGSVADEALPPVRSPVLVAEGNRPVSDWIEPVGGRPGTFRTVGVGRDRDVELVPFYRLHRRTYTTYWDLLTPAEFETRTAELAAERERVRRLDAATVAYVQTGEMQQERDFNQRGEETSVTRVDGRPGRRGTKWFSFDLPADDTRPAALVATYHRDSRRPRAFEVLLDGQRIGQESFAASSDARFFDVEYAIPPDLIKGKRQVTVRFEAAGGLEIATVFGLRMVRADAPR